MTELNFHRLFALTTFRILDELIFVLYAYMSIRNRDNNSALRFACVFLSFFFTFCLRDGNVKQKADQHTECVRICVYECVNAFIDHGKLLEVGVANATQDKNFPSFLFMLSKIVTQKLFPFSSS